MTRLPSPAEAASPAAESTTPAVGAPAPAALSSGRLKPWGILMSAPMVLALLAGRKTVTRRTSERWARCGVGRELWVRETFAVRRLNYWDDLDDDEYQHERAEQPSCMEAEEVYYRATPRVGLRRWVGPTAPPPDAFHGRPHAMTYLHESSPLASGPAARVERWTPGVHMPEWASRIRRRTVSVTREEWPGVPALSQAEAEREGFDSPDAFAALWVEINGPVGGVVYRIEMAEVERG
jgi:hypothetical protein